jgi:alpha-ribazole phosphatase
LKLIFIRHGKTKGNTQGRYVGRTDEPLLPESMEHLKKLAQEYVISGPESDKGSFLRPELVVTSPMLRCRQTADILFPNIPCFVQDGLQEMDFGEFEYKNYQELSGNRAYQAYIDSGGRTAFPGGESPKKFKTRCCKAFLEAVNQADNTETNVVAFVVHGGTIMAVLEAFGEPRRSYFDWQIKNGAYIWGEYFASGRIIIDCGNIF